MEGHVSAPILGTPAWYAQREIELLERLARQPQAVVQLWLRKVRIQSIANAQRLRRGSGCENAIRGKPDSGLRAIWVG